MKTAALLAALATACVAEDYNAGSGVASGSDIAVAGDIEVDTTWSRDSTYRLDGNIFVRNAVLTIEPGTTILGEPGSSLVITSSARVEAIGSDSAPILFTSSAPAGARTPGDWGGITLLGTAPINVAGGVDNIEGFAAGASDTEFGGTDPEHDCGTLRYVRIEFAGFELSPDNELNGLTVGACGSETTLDYIQVHKGADDGIEFFGGTADLRHAVLTQADDDGLDWDLGWNGTAQFLVVQQASTAGNAAFEADNNKNDNDAAPRSAPIIWNATLLGSNASRGEAFKTQTGMTLRRGTAGSLNNFVVAYFADYAIDIADYATVEQTKGGAPALAIRSSFFFDNADDVNDGWPDGFDVKEGSENDCEAPNSGCLDEAGLFASASMTNTFGVDPMLGDATNLMAPDFAPLAGSPVLSGGMVPGPGFDATATFIGAIGSEDWTAGWTAYPAN